MEDLNGTRLLLLLLDEEELDEVVEDDDDDEEEGDDIDEEVDEEEGLHADRVWSSRESTDFWDREKRMELRSCLFEKL